MTGMRHLLTIALQELRLQRRSPGYLLLLVGAVILGAYLGKSVWEAPVAWWQLVEMSPPTVLLAALYASYSLAVEDRERVAELWLSYPVSNAAQYFGKLVGVLLALVVPMTVVLAGVALALLADQRLAGWTLTALGYTAATLGLSLGLGVGLAGALLAFISSHRLRYLVTLASVIVLVWFLPESLVMQFRFTWAPAFGTVIFTSLPYNFSELWGLYPTGRAVGLHFLVQVVWILFVVVLGLVAYGRWRDRRGRPLMAAVMALIVLGGVFAVGSYQGYWQRAAAAVAADATYYEDLITAYRKAVVTPDGEVEAGPVLAAPPAVGAAATWDVQRVGSDQVGQWTATAYDLQVVLKPSTQELVAQGSIEVRNLGNTAIDRLAFTLARPLAVQEVRQAGRLLPVEREGDFFLVRLSAPLPAGRSTRLEVAWGGVWEVWGPHGYSPAMELESFVDSTGAFLSAYLGWYPLPGQRLLRFPSYIGRGDDQRLIFDVNPQALKGIAAVFRIDLQLPDSWTPVANTEITRESDRSYLLTTGKGLGYPAALDGVSVAAGPLVTQEVDGVKVVIAPSLTLIADDIAQLAREARRELADWLPSLGDDGADTGGSSEAGDDYGQRLAVLPNRPTQRTAVARRVIGDGTVITQPPLTLFSLGEADAIWLARHAKHFLAGKRDDRGTRSAIGGFFVAYWTTVLSGTDKHTYTWSQLPIATGIVRFLYAYWEAQYEGRLLAAERAAAQEWLGSGAHRTSGAGGDLPRFATPDPNTVFHALEIFDALDWLYQTKGKQAVVSLLEELYKESRTQPLDSKLWAEVWQAMGLPTSAGPAVAGPADQATDAGTDSLPPEGRRF